MRSSASRIAAGCCSQRRVLPSMSVNRKVTVAVGNSGILGFRSAPMEEISTIQVHHGLSKLPLSRHDGVRQHNKKHGPHSAASAPEAAQGNTLDQRPGGRLHAARPTGFLLSLLRSAILARKKIKEEAFDA
jgi:hypothetical protein